MATVNIELSAVGERLTGKTAVLEVCKRALIAEGYDVFHVSRIIGDNTEKIRVCSPVNGFPPKATPE